VLKQRNGKAGADIGLTWHQESGRLYGT
jgi:hypothetical protein